MKKLFALFSLFFSLTVMAQVGVNTESPRGVLEVNSGPDKNQGFVMPEVSKVEDVVNSHETTEEVALGTMVYDSSRDAICFRYPNAWRCVSQDGPHQVVAD